MADPEQIDAQADQAAADADADRAHADGRDKTEQELRESADAARRDDEQRDDATSSDS